MTRPIIRDSRTSGLCRKARRRTADADTLQQNVIVMSLLVLLGVAILVTRYVVGV
ncbi:MAG: hypothetical protein HYR85_03385 [Planctomycetes bacterium]|nr:hypothetical protein [Planctomycetota bacterium]MBI3847598.1 hypothetical protein [Planctomycetota bacterium]